jgi:hypothetical protein
MIGAPEAEAWRQAAPDRRDEHHCQRENPYQRHKQDKHRHDPLYSLRRSTLRPMRYRRAGVGAFLHNHI